MPRLHPIGFSNGQLYQGNPIERDTPIIPCIIADGVIDEINRLLQTEVLGRAHADRLAAHAEMIYARNKRFARKIRSRFTVGRDTLYLFMRHWASSLLASEFPAEAKKLPRGYGWDC